MEDNNDTRTPRERISNEFMRQMLNGNDGNGRGRADIPGEGDYTNFGQYNDYQNNGRKSCDLEYAPLAMVYSPIQKWRGAYDIDTAIERGTMFRELDLPFLASKGAKRGGCGCNG